ncbi:MAG: hypothetical protein DWH79_02445 [Planctomycetota bacterium]|nr:MAG: hypothetical protein DWH79_02445 [Planctomycetota bacterium]
MAWSRLARGATAAVCFLLAAGGMAVLTLRGCHREGAVDPALLVAQGWEAVDRQDAVAARETVRRLRARGAEDLASVLQARLLVARGFFRPAIDILAGLGATGEARTDTELDRLGHLVRGEAAYRLQMYPVAEQEFRRVLAVAPDSPDAHRLLAAMYYDAGVIPAAIEHLQQTARLAPSDPRPLRLLGLIHNDYERYEEAVGFYEQSLERSPEQVDRDEVLTELAACQVKLRRHRDALVTLGKLPTGNVADVLRAECHLAIGDRGVAEGIMAGVLRSSPDDLGALLVDGAIRLEDGDAGGAVEPLSRAVALHPRDYLAHLKLAQAYAGCGRDVEANAERTEAERLRGLRREFADLHQEAWNAPGDALVRRKLAGLAAQLGRPDLEQVWLDAAAAVVPGSNP